MGGKSSKEKKEEPKLLNTTVTEIINNQKIYIKDDCTAGESCVKFTDYNQYHKKYNNIFLKEYEYYILIIIFFLLLFMMLYMIPIYKKNSYKR
jgi:hypothetical protein